MRIRLAIGAAIAVAAAAVVLWCTEGGLSRLTFQRSAFSVFQHSAIRHDASFAADLTGEGIAESYRLVRGRLTVRQQEAVLWQTPPEWWVDQAVVADATDDHRPDLVLSVWKSGDFGSARPFWVTKNNPSVKNHLFVFKWEKGSMAPVWQSSNLGRPNCEIALTDVDGDQRDELVVIEGEYGWSNDCHGRYLAVWKWDQWGFTNLWRSEAGEYHRLLPWSSNSISKHVWRVSFSN